MARVIGVRSDGGLRMEKYKVFFSWQSDTKGNKGIIKESLKAACQLASEKFGCEILIDEATRDVPGMPKIEDTVFEKIDKCDVFVCDITPVSVLGNKHMPNSNVIIELGYAIKSKGYLQIIALAKKGEWKPEQLPFDINHHRIGQFESAKDCNLNFEIESAINDVRTQWKSRLIRLWHWMKNKAQIGAKKGKEELFGPEEPLVELTNATEDSVTFFSRRLGRAFGGDRGLVEYTKPKEIAYRLSLLLHQPLKFKKGIEGASTLPIWNFWSGSSEGVESFRILNKKKVLINTNELLLRRMVVFRDSARLKWQYIYFEASADKPTGLYKHDYSAKRDMIELSGFYSEEYAVFRKNRFITRNIKHEEYDDGACVIGGKIYSTFGKAEPRVRYLSTYNFIMCAQAAPYNSRHFDRTSKDMLKKMLNYDITINEFHQYMMSIQGDSRLERMYDEYAG